MRIESSITVIEITIEASVWQVGWLAAHQLLANCSRPAIPQSSFARLFVHACTRATRYISLSHFMSSTDQLQLLEQFHNTNNHLLTMIYSNLLALLLLVPTSFAL